VGLVLQNEKWKPNGTIIAAGCFSATIEGMRDTPGLRPAKGQMAALRADDLKMETRALVGEDLSRATERWAHSRGGDGRVRRFRQADHRRGIEKFFQPPSILRRASQMRALKKPGQACVPILRITFHTRPDGRRRPADLPRTLRSGILLAPITARLVREWITEQRVSADWDRFSPLRFPSATTDGASRAPA